MRQFIFSHCPWFLKETFVRWIRNDGLNQAAAMAYYGALSFLPILLLLVAALGHALSWYSNKEYSAKETIREFVASHTSDEMATQVQYIVNQVIDHAPKQTGIGLFTLFIGAIGIFTQLSAAFDRIWHQNSPELHGVWGAVKNALSFRLKAFVTLVGFAIMVLAGFAAGIVLESVHDQLFGELPYWNWIETFSSAGLNLIAFTILYSVMPRAPVRWLHALSGAFFVVIVWEAGRRLLQYVIVRGNYTAYGVVGTFIALMLWVYYASLLLFLGAQMVQVIGYPEDARPETSQ
jgi:membrane protein